MASVFEELLEKEFGYGDTRSYMNAEAFNHGIVALAVSDSGFFKVIIPNEKQQRAHYFVRFPPFAKGVEVWHGIPKGHLDICEKCHEDTCSDQN